MAITLAGQFVIRFIEKNVNEYMNKILKTHDKIDYIVASRYRFNLSYYR